MDERLFVLDPGASAPVHASCVAVAGRGLLILGASGAGKSALSLQLMAFGAELVGDDRLLLSGGTEAVFAGPVPRLAGAIEARGLGLLRAPNLDRIRLSAVLDLDRTETERMPAPRQARVLGCVIPLLYRIKGPHFAPALIQFLKSGLRDDL